MQKNIDKKMANNTNNTTPPTRPEGMHWLVRPKTIRKLWIGGIALLAIIVAMGSFAHPHVYFGIEGTFGFFAWYGLVTCVVMVIGSKLLGMALKRGENYYD